MKWNKCLNFAPCRDGIEVAVAGWTAEREIRVRFGCYSACGPLTARMLKTSSEVLVAVSGLARTLKTPSFPWSWVPSSRSKLRNLT